MHTIFQITFAFAAVHSIQVTTAFHIESRGTFSAVQKLNSTTKFVRNGPAAYARGLSNSKNKPLQVPHVATSDHGSVIVTPSDAYDSQYICPVDIGGQTLGLILDTGSADLCV
jgi:hypothetical protein